MKAWIMETNNILGLVFIFISAICMVIKGHDVFGVLQFTDKLIIPIAAIPIGLGFLMLRTDIAGNVAALKNAIKPPT